MEHKEEVVALMTCLKQLFMIRTPQYINPGTFVYMGMIVWVNES